MDDALELLRFLPISLRNPAENGYLGWLWDAFESNYGSGNFQFAFLAYHMLTMAFVYFKIWQWREAFPEDFEKGLIGFARAGERKCLRNGSPFAFSRVNERAILRLCRLFGCDDSELGRYRKLVDDRNHAAHANGNVYYETRREMDTKIRETLRAVRTIQCRSKNAVIVRYEDFLVESGEPESREFLDDRDQVREILIRGNCFSREDTAYCAEYDTSELGRGDKAVIRELHESLCELTGD